MRRRRLLAAALLPAVLAALAAPAAATAQQHGAGRVHLTYLGETELPHAAQVDGTTLGGLSAISWDRRSGRYLLISDDRSNLAPARFYRAAIDARAGRVSVRIIGTTPFTRPDGSVFPATSADGSTIAPDPEGIAVDPVRRRIAWSSEGERIVSPGRLVLGDPAVRFADPEGRTTAVLPLAPQLHVNAQPVGPRQNQTLEGLTFSPDGSRLTSAMEDPLYQDGDDPTAAHGALVRVTVADARTGLPRSQAAYRLEPLFEDGPEGATNGLSDLVSLGGTRYLVIERAFTTRNRIRIFEADARGATDVLGRDSLQDGRVVPMRKRLVADLSDVRGLPRIDNVEGITLGPRLRDGRRLVVLVSDDNFSTGQVTQLIAFAASGV